MITVEKSKFEQLVQAAIEGLSKNTKEKMDNVAVIVEKSPSKKQMEAAGADGGILFGLYQGVPKPKREKYSGVLPDKIFIFQDSIEKVANGEKQIKNKVQETIRHEFAHHFGYDEEGVEELQNE